MWTIKEDSCKTKQSLTLTVSMLLIDTIPSYLNIKTIPGLISSHESVSTNPTTLSTLEPLQSACQICATLRSLCLQSKLTNMSTLNSSAISKDLWLRQLSTIAWDRPKVRRRQWWLRRSVRGAHHKILHWVSMQSALMVIARTIAGSLSHKAKDCRQAHHRSSSRLTKDST